MKSKRENYRELEESIHTDLEDRLSYNKYLHLDDILGAQHPRSEEHDEMLFIIIHQASELWLKLAGNELEAAIEFISGGNHRQAFKVVARVKLILNQITQSWNILATMTPVDYLNSCSATRTASWCRSTSTIRRFTRASRVT